MEISKKPMAKPREQGRKVVARPRAESSRERNRKLGAARAAVRAEMETDLPICNAC